MVLKKTRTLILLALIIASLFVASCKQDVSDGVTCMVNGFVYDVESKLPIEGATVSIGNKVGVTNEEGYFVVSGVGAGTYEVGIAKNGYIPGKVEDLVVNPGFFREVRGEDLAYYRNQITADGGEDETRISVSGDYDVQALADGTVIISNEGAAPQQDVIDSIGDASRYSQTILGVALRPAGGMLSGSVKGLSVIANAQNPEGDYYEIPDGTGIAAFYLPTTLLAVPANVNLFTLIQDIERDEGAALKKGVMAFRSVVYDGSFTFAGLPNGYYAIVVDPFLVEGEAGIVEVPQTVCYYVADYEPEDALTNVIDGYGDAGTIFAVFDDTLVTEALELISIRAVDRSELPIETERTINTTTGGGFALYFSKTLDMEYEAMEFSFKEGAVVIPGTQYVIENYYDLGLGVVYVWNDEFTRLQTTDLAAALTLNYKVSSFNEGDVAEGSKSVETIYHMGIAGTNLYEFKYDYEVNDAVLVPGEPIEIRMDQEIPEDAYVEARLVYFKDQQPKEVLFEYDIEGDTLFIEPLVLDFDFGTKYYLSFKIYSWDDVVLYSTFGGLTEAEALGLVERGDDDPGDEYYDYIYFETAAHQDFEIFKTGVALDTCATNLTITGAVHDLVKNTWTYNGETENFDVYGEDIYIILTSPVLEIDGEYDITAKLTWNYNGNEVPVEVEFHDDLDLVTISIDDDYRLFPFGQEYTLEVTAYDDELQKIIINNEITVLPTELYLVSIFDEPNGLDSFDMANTTPIDAKHPELFDSKDPTAKFSWKSAGFNFGKADVYYLLKLDEDLNVLSVLEKDAEISKIVYQYNKEFKTGPLNVIYVGTDVDDAHIDELAFGGTVGFVLISYDDCGRLIQSPIIWVEDEVSPKLVPAINQQLPLLPAGDYAKDTSHEFYLKAETNELLEFESDLATWTGDVMDKVFVDSEIIYTPDITCQTTVKVTVTFGAAVTLTDGNDLTIEITASDTSGNYSKILEVTPSQNN